MEHRIVKGISEGFHDASVSLVKYDGNAEILWCKHSERITRKKNENNNEYCTVMLWTKRLLFNKQGNMEKNLTC